MLEWDAQLLHIIAPSSGCELNATFNIGYSLSP